MSEDNITPDFLANKDITRHVDSFVIEEYNQHILKGIARLFSIHNVRWL